MTAAAGPIAAGTHQPEHAAWCSRCAAGVGPTSDRQALAWADRHNAEHHALEW